MEPRPVLLLHGILGQRHVYWNLFRRRLEEAGFAVEEVVLPYGMLGDLRIAGRILADRVEDALRRHAVDRVDLVCHSAGGLVARYYLKLLDGNRSVRHIVTMGTPHAGTLFSYLVPVPLAPILQQARPHSDFLQEINADPTAVPGVQHTNFWSHLDAVVVPASSGVMPGARNVEIPFVSHWSFLWRRDVHRRIVAALQGGDPEEA